MIPVDQTVVHGERGNCLQASIASLFELKLEQVPHFMLFNGPIQWNDVLYCFIWAMGYDWIANGDPTESKIIKRDRTINGLTEACVPSKNFPEKYHSVIIDINGNVVHDPGPKKSYLGINVIESGDIVSWIIFKPRAATKDK